LRHHLLLALERAVVTAHDDVGQLFLFAIGEQALRGQHLGELSGVHRTLAIPPTRANPVDAKSVSGSHSMHDYSARRKLASSQKP
jgi:hypothetical protein